MATGLIEAATPILNGLVGYEQMAELMEPFILTAVIVTPILLGALYVARDSFFANTFNGIRTAIRVSISQNCGKRAATFAGTTALVSDLTT